MKPKASFPTWKSQLRSFSFNTDGMYKYYTPSPQFCEKRRRVIAEQLLASLHEYEHQQNKRENGSQSTSSKKAT